MKHKIKPLITFFISLIILVSLLILISYLINVNLILLAPLYMFTPFVATIIACFINKIPFKDLGISLKFNKWFIISWLLPVILILAILLISFLFPGIKYSPTMQGLLAYGATPESIAQGVESYSKFGFPPIIFAILLGLIAGPTINTLFSFGEEIGWRGFLQKELSHLGFWKSSLLIGLIWGIWHAPIILQGYNYPQHPLIGVGMMIIFTVLLSPLLCYARKKTKSVFAPSIMHGTINALAGIAIAFVMGGNDLIVGIQGLSGFIVLAIVNIGLLKFAKIK